MRCSQPTGRRASGAEALHVLDRAAEATIPDLASISLDVAEGDYVDEEITVLDQSFKESTTPESFLRGSWTYAKGCWRSPTISRPTDRAGRRGCAGPSGGRIRRAQAR